MILASYTSTVPVQVQAPQQQSSSIYTALEQVFAPHTGQGDRRINTPQLVIDIALTRDGRDLKESEHHEFSHNQTAPVTVETSTAKAMKYAHLLARVYDSTVALTRATISELDAEGAVIEGGSYSFPLELNGLFLRPNGVKMASRANVLRFEKVTTIKGRTGRFDLRGVFTAPELAQYTADKTLPARFTAAGATEFAAGTWLEAFMAAATDGPLKLSMPAVKVGGVLTSRPVTSIRAAGLRQTKPTRQRTSTKAKYIDATQQRINGYGSDAQFILDRTDSGQPNTDETARINLLKTAAKLWIGKLEPEYQARIVVPESLTPLTP